MVRLNRGRPRATTSLGVSNEDDGFTPFGQTPFKTQPGVPKPFFGDIGKGFEDAMGGLGKGIGGIGGGLANLFGQDDRPGQGSDAVSRQQKILEQQRHAQRGRAQQDQVYRNRGMHQQEQQQAAPKGFIEYLKEALGVLGGDQGGAPFVNFDPQRNALRQNTAEGDANLANMYLALQGQFRDAVPGIQANTDQTSAAVNANSDTAQQNLSQSNTAIRDEQSRQLADLGIEDALTNLVTSGNSQARDQAAAAGGIEQSRNNVLGAVASGGKSAEDFTTGIGQTAGLEGAEKRASLQRSLVQGLADIDSQEQSQNSQIAASNASNRGGSFAQAMNLAGILSGEDPNSYQSQAQQAQQQWENDMQAAQFNAKYSQQDRGVDPQTLLDFVSQMQQGTGQTYDTDQYLKSLDLARKIFSR